MEVKLCKLHSLGQSEVLLLLLSNGQRVGSGEIICHHPVTRTSPQIPKAPNLDNPSIRELKENLPRAELFRKHSTNKTLLVKPNISQEFHKLISAINLIFQNAHKQAGYGTFSCQLLISAFYGPLAE